MTRTEVIEGLVDRELASLDPGLTSDGLHRVLHAGILAQGQTTPNDSPCWRGGQARGHMIRAIRDWLCPLGWRKSDTLNLALIENPRESIAIAITSGDHNTGRRGDADPRTRTPRGQMTIGKVQLNQLSFMEELLGSVGRDERRLLWVFLFNIEEMGAYSELSLPLAVGDDDRIIEWKKRILLPAVDLSTPKARVSRPEDEPVLVVPVHRK